MRIITALATAAFASALLAGVAAADDRIHLTPPLYRDQARATQQNHPASELTTTPQPVSGASTGRVSGIGTVTVAANIPTAR